MTFDLTRPGIEFWSTVSVVDALSTQPVMNWLQWLMLPGP